MLSTSVTVDSIDEAWEEARRACPRGWAVAGVRGVISYLAADNVLSVRVARWQARAVSPNPLVDCIGVGSSAASALRDLADNLRLVR